MTYKEYIKRNRISKITKQFGLLDDLMNTCIKDILLLLILRIMLI